MFAEVTEEKLVGGEHFCQPTPHPEYVKQQTPTGNISKVSLMNMLDRPLMLLNDKYS